MEAHLLTGAIARWRQITASPAGEKRLLEQFLSGQEEGVSWFRVIQAASVCSQPAVQELFDRPLVREMCKMAEGPLVSAVDNFTPPERTPWGGFEIVRKYKSALGVRTCDVVGESWEVSGHPSFPSRFPFHYEGMKAYVPLTVIEQLAPHRLYGEGKASSADRTMPLLIKLLNSGSWHPHRHEWLRLVEQVGALELPEEWKRELSVDDLRDISNFNNDRLHRALTTLQRLLAREDCPDCWKPLGPPIERIHQEMVSKNLSVQVHPRKGDYPEFPPKTEAWTILSAEKGAGIYLGLKEGVSEPVFAESMRKGEDVTQYMNFVEVAPNDVFYIPAGTLHAIGAGLLIVEVQQTSESTFRAYDWCRLREGKPRMLHYDETIKSTAWEAIRGQQLVDALRRQGRLEGRTDGSATVETLINEEPFQQSRLTFASSEQEYLGDTTPTGLQAMIVTEGQVVLQTAAPGKTTISAGTSCILPASLGPYRMGAACDGTRVLLFTAVDKIF